MDVRSPCEALSRWRVLIFAYIALEKHKAALRRKEVRELQLGSKCRRSIVSIQIQLCQKCAPEAIERLRLHHGAPVGRVDNIVRYNVRTPRDGVVGGDEQTCAAVGESATKCSMVDLGES